MAGNKPPPQTSSARPPAPTISLPPRSSIEGLFTGGPEASPGPMTLVSSFFAENDPDNDFRSFSQLLAGDMSPAAVPDIRKSFAQPEAAESDGGSGEFRFQQNRPTGLMVSQGMFTIPPGLSPATLLDSPGFFSSSQGMFGIPNQQFSNQITSQAHAQAQPQPIPSNAYLQQKKPYINDSHSDYKSQPPNITIDKPTNDGYNWRKYGQKQVKGSEYPRSYYKCSHPNCPVKKKVERSFEGQITEIIYKGQHNHSPPTKRTKDNVNNSDGNSDFAQNKPKDQSFSYLSSTKDQESSQITPENNIYGSSDSDEVGDAETRVNRRDEDEPESKRRNIEVQTSEQALDHRSVTEPRIIVQTTSEVDLLDDGFRWRKYGQKVVKGNSYPRSYYKCTSPGCNVRKQIERAASDPKAVVTTYEGKHNHDIPAAKNSSHNTTNSTSNFRPSNTVIDRQMGNRRNEFGDNEQLPVALLRFKEEQIT